MFEPSSRGDVDNVMTNAPNRDRDIFRARLAPSRRAAVLGGAALLATGGWAEGAGGFSAFLSSLRTAAESAGVRPATFDALVADLEVDRGLPRGSAGQPEFERPLADYYREAVGPGRVARGRALAAAHAGVLVADERRYGVPGPVALAAWGMESDYGRAGLGSRDVLRTVATLAYTRPDRPSFRDEVVAAMLILDRGDVERSRLVGSWAGAMGAPQFLPSAYLKYAVSASGGAPDIWTSPPDILASAANFLKQEGWAPGEPWIAEVALPQGFDFPTLHASAAEWERLGVRRRNGSAVEGAGEAALFLPAGAAGPAFLLFQNYFVIKQYNNSDSYALSFGSLAQRIAGEAAPDWPTRSARLSLKDRTFIQQRLAALGLYGGRQDGKFGPKARDAIHAYQKQAGLAPADGFATPALVDSLRSR